MAVVNSTPSSSTGNQGPTQRSGPRIVPAIPRGLGIGRKEKKDNAEAKAPAGPSKDVNGVAPHITEASPAITATVHAQKESVSAGEASVKTEDVQYTEPGASSDVKPPTLQNGDILAPASENEHPSIANEGLVSASGMHVPPSDPTGVPTPISARENAPKGSQPPQNMPPPFYPAPSGSNPASVTSSSMQPMPQTSGVGLPPPPGMHEVVFGGRRDSSNVSPGSQLQNHQQPAPPMQAAPQQWSGPLPTSAPFVPSGHAHHYSEPQLPYPPPFAYGPGHYHSQHQPRPFYPNNGRHHHYPRRHQEHNFNRHLHGPPPLGPAYHGLPAGPGPRPIANVNEVSKTIHPDMMRDHMSVGPSFRQSSVSHSEGQPPFEARGPAAQEDPASMARYFVSQFGNPEFADYLMQLSHVNFTFPRTSIPAHGVILARSPKLRSLMSMPASQPQNDLKVLNVEVSDRFLNVDNALIRAIMRLYGEALPDKQDVARAAAPIAQREGLSPDVAQMRYVLALAASGHFLQIDEVISHGLLLVGHLLSWASLPQALAFALEGGLSTAFVNTETAALNGSNASSGGTPTKLDSPSSAPAYGFYSDRLLHHIMSFIVHNVSPSFSFSAAASQLTDPPRLPSEAEPKHSRSASFRLQQIRFGEMTVNDTTNANGPNAPNTDPLSTAISSVLLSLPFPLLHNLSENAVLGERLSWGRVASIMGAAIQERENRRKRALAGKPANEDEHGLWRVVRLQEFVEPTERHPLGVKLMRRFVDADTPAGSEKS